MSRLKAISLLFFALFGQLHLFAQSVENYYWVAFTDKNGSAYSVSRPEEFLSEKAIGRRLKQHIPVDETDLPVSMLYVDSLRSLGITVLHQSKWLNGVTIKTDGEKAGLLQSLDFIAEIQLTKPGLITKSAIRKLEDEKFQSDYEPSLYGSSSYQLEQLNGQFLHQNHFRGEGVAVAVFDAGFYKADEYAALGRLFADGRVLGSRDFVLPEANIFEASSHGLSVLSTMAGWVEGELIGTAPEAFYYLFRTEDSSSEFLVEEDNWVAAAEYADSLGVDIINSSLGYFEFQDPLMNHTYSQMDGHTTRVTRAANMAVQKGILVFSSAGNEADNPWKYIIAPADGDLVIAVGAVGRNGNWAPFSSLGPAADGDIKPNVVATGWGTTLVKADGIVGYSSGTSFSSPVLAGMAACLWQANPKATALQLKFAIEYSASQYLNPDSVLGYGIPDFQLADQYLKEILPKDTKKWSLYPNPYFTDCHLVFDGDLTGESIEVRIIDMRGAVVYRQKMASENPVMLRNLANLPRGMYLVRITTENEIVTLKLVKAGR